MSHIPVFQKLIIRDVLVTYYEVNRRGDSVPLVFLHGWRSESTTWFRAISTLPIPMIFIDLPGFGKSEIPPDSFNLDDYRQTVHDILAKLAIKKCVLVGHSFGGRIAVKFAVRYPQIVTSLILVDAAGIQKKTLDKKIKGLTAKVVKPFFRFPGLQSLRKAIYTAMGSEDYIATPKLTKIYQNIMKEDLMPLYSQISCPTMIVWGNLDQDTPLSDAQTMNTLIPTSELKVIDGAGHFSFIDKPKEFKMLVEEFIKKF